MRDYPHPPVAVPSDERVRVVHAGRTIVDTTSSARVLEQSHAPVYFVPRSDVAMESLVPSERRTVCEWMGVATYFDLMVDGNVVPNAAWTYEIPTSRFASIAGHIAFYVRSVDECWVEAEQAQAPDGDPYRGWITSSVVGPFTSGPRPATQ